MPRMSSAHPKVRRTQAERRVETLGKIHRAMIECLAERGYAQTSLPDVLSRAGVSRGALWGYYKSKTELAVAVAIELGHELESSVAALSPHGPMEPSQLVDELVGDPGDPGRRALRAIVRAAVEDDRLWHEITRERPATAQDERVLSRLLNAQESFGSTAGLRVLALAVTSLELLYRDRNAELYLSLLADINQVAATLLDDGT